MYLSRLEVFGFKSFAQRIHLRFDNGLTAIVGPNGCGKTNIVDAIRWALGEQKSSVLRSDKMENVIFNGTKSRKPLGMSEVSITIENTKKILPSEYTEVTITRRLYRNGDSEYLLNKVPCRLRDIQNLFIDTGMGSDAYSVIELKMIDQILSDNANERRKLFEEAAGISKYKQRRKQTFAKLETTLQDLNRVKDIVIEVEKKVNSLERQAKKAEQARTLRVELRALDLTLAEYLLYDLSEKTQPLKEKLSHEESTLAHYTAVLNELDTEVASMSRRVQEKEIDLSDLKRNSQSKQDLVVQTEKQILSSEERLKSISELVSRSEAEAQSSRVRIDDIAEARAALLLQLNEKEAEAEHAKQELERKQSAYQEQGLALRESRTSLEQLRLEKQRLASEISKIKLETQTLLNRVETFDLQIQRQEERKRFLLTELEHRRSESGTLGSRIEEAKLALAASERDLDEAITRRQKLEQDIAQKKEIQLQLRAEVSSHTSRIEFLRSLLESYEGLPEGVKVLDRQTTSTGERKYGLGTLSDLLSADQAYSMAVNAALGEAQNFYVSRTLEEAFAGIAELKHASKGKLTFIVLDRIPSIHTDALPDTLQPIESLIRCREELRPLLKLLLNRTVLASTLEEAREKSTQHPSLVFCTPDGERISGQGFLRGGSVSALEGIRIGKREELEHRQIEKQRLETELRQVIDEIDLAQKQLSATSLTVYEHQVRAAIKSISDLENKMTQLSFEEKSFYDEINVITSRIDADRLEKEKLAIRAAELEPQLRDSEARERNEHDALQLAIESLSSEERDIERAAEAVQAQTLLLRESHYEVERRKTALQQIQNDELSAKRQIERSATEIAQAEEEAFRLKGELETMRANLKLLSDEKASLNALISERETQYRDLRGELNQIETRAREVARSKEVLGQVILTLQKEILHLELQEENLKTSIKHDYDVILEVKKPEDPKEGEAPFNKEEAAEKVQHLKSKLRNLGGVNELALEEFQTERDRYDFLVAQQNDLLDSEKKLRETIEEINKTAVEQFNQTFTQIRNNFVSIFRELFNEGDEADLIIEEAEDPLDANIDIIAKPKGKRPQAITLLSGGEKTLTATALLFSIYLVKPSPFCILDEVDAPLDDANLDRFIKLIKKFAGETQFIMVTHNKRTMEAAGVMYGVTMEEEGVSKLVAARFDDFQKN